MENQKPSYLVPTVTNSVIVGAVVTVISLVGLYVAISGEPTGSMFSASSVLPILSCLVAAIAGVLSVKAYANMEGAEVTLGNGAVIGIVAGLITAITSTLISQIWTSFIDPALMDNFANYMIRNMEMVFNNMGMAADQADIALGEMEKSFADQKTMLGVLKGLGWSALGFSVINIISGLITAKISAKDDE